jgi:Methylamine utilization protein MauJ
LIHVNVPPKPPEADEGKLPWHLEIPSHKEVFVGELAERGDWIVANIQTDCYWPVTSQKVRWRGVDIWIVPITKGFYPAVAMMVPRGKHRAECEELLMRFLSILSWVKERGFMVEEFSGSNVPRPMGRRDEERGFSICEEFALNYFPEVTDKKALLALGLMREGRALNHVGYAFLSFYRVLEVAFSTDSQRIAWISAALANLTGYGVKEALDAIKAQGVADIGRHLFRSGRCAMAHANRKPIVDPDKPADLRRLRAELPIVRALAAKAIEDRLGVESSQTVYRNHLYELAGFKEILGAEIVGFVTRGEQITEQRMLEIPDISVQIRRRDPYAPLHNLTVKGVGQKDKLLFMRFESKEGDVIFRFALDFGNERLEFSLFRDLRVKDTGTAESAEGVAEIRRFERDYFGNGELRIVNADSGELIGRKDPYIPLNMLPDLKAADAEIARWKALAQQRRDRARRYAEEGRT